MTEEQIRKLIENLNPNVKMPRGFHLYSRSFAIMWLKSNQKKPKPVKKL